MTSLVLIFPAGSNNKNEPLDYHADILMPACAKSARGGRLPTLYKIYRPVPDKKKSAVGKKIIWQDYQNLYMFCIYILYFQPLLAQM